jgi:hypothetical protein
LEVPVDELKPKKRRLLRRVSRRLEKTTDRLLTTGVSGIIVITLLFMSLDEPSFYSASSQNSNPSIELIEIKRSASQRSENFKYDEVISFGELDPSLLEKDYPRLLQEDSDRLTEKTRKESKKKKEKIGSWHRRSSKKKKQFK